jgi:hypothetical protein
MVDAKEKKKLLDHAESIVSRLGYDVVDEQTLKSLVSL